MKKRKRQIYIQRAKRSYIDDNDLENLRDNIPQKYCDDRHLWLSVSDLLKGLDNYKAFEK